MITDPATLQKTKIDIVKTIIIVGFGASIFYHYILAYYLTLNSYPFNTFLFKPIDKFNDFYNIYHATEGLDPYSSRVSVYFPFTFVVMYLFTMFKVNLAFSIYLLFFTAFLIYFISGSLKDRGRIEKISDLFVLIFLSYPFLFTIDRGNLEILVFLSLAFFIHFHLKGKDRLSVLFLSFATAMKLYPAIFALFYLKDKKYRNILMSILLVVALSLSSAVIFKGGVQGSINGLQNNLEIFKRDYVLANNGLQHNTSIYGAIKILYYGAIDILNSKQLPDSSHFKNKNMIPKNGTDFSDKSFIYIIPAMILGCLLIFLFFGEKVLWKKVSLLVFIILLLPQVSFDYKLIHLYIPLILFFRDDKEGRMDLIYAGLFGLLFIPKDYYLIINDISIAVLINPLLMLTITGMIILERYGFIPDVTASPNGQD